MAHQFNAAGTAGRDCPVCYRTGTLTGDRADGAILACTGGMPPGRSADLKRGGCSARFTFRPNHPAGPTLERLAVDLWNHGARLADDHFCPGCSARGHQFLCSTCSREEARA